MRTRLDLEAAAAAAADPSRLNLNLALPKRRPRLDTNRSARAYVTGRDSEAQNEGASFGWKQKKNNFIFINFIRPKIKVVPEPLGVEYERTGEISTF